MKTFSDCNATNKLHIRNVILILLLNINREVHTENYIAMQTADGAGGRGWMAGDSHLGVEWHIVPELCKPVKTEREKKRRKIESTFSQGCRAH